MKKKDKHWYKVLYEIGEFSREDVLKSGKGATDAFVFMSLIYPEDGSFSMNFFSKDGRTQKLLDDKELFKAWSMLAKRLSESETLEPTRKSLAGKVFNIVRNAVIGNRP